MFDYEALRNPKKSVVNDRICDVYGLNTYPNSPQRHNFQNTIDFEICRGGTTRKTGFTRGLDRVYVIAGYKVTGRVSNAGRLAFTDVAKAIFIGKRL